MGVNLAIGSSPEEIIANNIEFDLWECPVSLVLDLGVALAMLLGAVWNLLI